MRSTIPFPLLVGVAAAFLSGGVMAGELSSPSEARGYAACVNKVEREHGRFNVEADYYTNTHAHTREFYLNGRARTNGEWGPLRVACETTRSGSRIVALQIQTGRYVGRLAPEIAQH